MGDDVRWVEMGDDRRHINRRMIGDGIMTWQKVGEWASVDILYSIGKNKV